MRHLILPIIIVCFAAKAHAFEISTPVTNGCHEELTLAAARAAAFPLFAAAPAPTEDQRRAMNDLVFGLPHDDPWSLALFIGVRSNDLKDNAPTNIDGLFHVHDDPADQPAHCMRRQQDDGPEGDVGALAACREFIVGELEAGGLLDDVVDLAATTPVTTFFRFRGVYEILLPRYAYHLGRAAHAIQDGYTHSMRDAATGRVVSVLNWVDAYGDNSYVEAEDGYQHLSGLDDCKRTDPHQLLRIDRARQATTNLFAELASDAPGRRARVLATVDAALDLIPGCDTTNRYCDAPELDEDTGMRTFGCAIPDGAGGGMAAIVIALLVVARRRRRRVAAAFVLVAVLAVAAQAETLPATAPVVASTKPEPTGVEGQALSKVDSADRWHRNHWHLDGRMGASFDDAAVGAMIGIGRTQDRWLYGFIVEWNPWFSVDRFSARSGTVNAYLTLGYRWFQGTRLNISTRIEAGTSTMMFELLGLDKYTTGLYVGGALVAIRFPITKRLAVTFDPIHFAMPVPRPVGLPFYYKQYRVTFGVEMRL